MSEGVAIKFGAMYDDKLAAQLVQEAGFKVEDAEQFQADAKAITRLYVRRYVQDAKVNAMRSDLIRRIQKHCKGVSK